MIADPIAKHFPTETFAGDITFRQLLTTSTTEQESNTKLFLIYEIMHNFVFNNYYMHIVKNNTTNRGTIYPALLHRICHIKRGCKYHWARPVSLHGQSLEKWLVTIGRIKEIRNCDFVKVSRSIYIYHLAFSNSRLTCIYTNKIFPLVIHIQLYEVRP